MKKVLPVLLCGLCAFCQSSCTRSGCYCHCYNFNNSEHKQYKMNDNACLNAGVLSDTQMARTYGWDSCLVSEAR